MILLFTTVFFLKDPRSDLSQKKETTCFAMTVHRPTQLSIHFFDSNPKTLKLLDLLIAEIKPEYVVETGVAKWHLNAHNSTQRLKTTDLKKFSAVLF